MAMITLGIANLFACVIVIDRKEKQMLWNSNNSQVDGIKQIGALISLID